LKYLIGFPVEPPDFMLKNKTEEKKYTLLTSFLSDSEGTPAIEKVKKSKGEDSLDKCVNILYQLSILGHFCVTMVHNWLLTAS
jgi:hypothetical protein